jgi:hypothetical protein
MSSNVIPFALAVAPDPIDRLAHVTAEIEAIERAWRRLPALKRERIALRKAAALPDRTRLPYRALPRAARRSALYAALHQRGMNWHASLRKDAPPAAFGWALGAVREMEWRSAAAVQEQAEALGGARNLMEAARLVERDLLREWWLASPEGEAALRAGEDVARRRADSHVSRHATPSNGMPRPLALALYKIARARTNALIDRREAEALQGDP